MGLFSSDEKTVNKKKEQRSTFNYGLDNLKQSLGLVNTQTDFKADVPINVDAPTTNTSRVYAPTDARSWGYTDARQISIISRSPNASQTAKKKDKVSQEGSTPQQSISPRQSGSTVPVEAPISVPTPSVGGGLSTWLIVGGVVVGGYYLLSGSNDKNEKKQGGK